MTWKSLHGNQVQYHSRMPLMRVNGSEFGPGAYPVRGRRLYVDSNWGAAGVAGESLYSPLSTLQAAIDRLDTLGTPEDNTGAEIVCLPNHAETVTGVGGLTFDVPGLTVTGLGNYNQRPRFLMDGGTTVTAVISGADVTLRNLVFASGHASVATLFGVTGVGAHIDRCEATDNTTSESFVLFASATGAAGTANGLKITNSRWVPLISSVDATNFLNITDDIADLVVADNFVCHEGASATVGALILQAGTKVMTRVQVTGNLFSSKITAGDILIDNGGSANSGIFAYNLLGHADVTGAHAVGACTGCRFFENYSVSTAVLSGVLLPAADVDL